MTGELLDENKYETLKGRYLYIIFTTKNVKTKRDYQKALNRLEKKWKNYCYSTGKHYTPV